VVLGLAAALTASALFNVGIVLQAIDARNAPKALALRVGLLLRLFRRPVWVVGWLLGVIGIWPQIVAYGHAPFVVAQPALAVGLLLMLALGVHVLGERVGVKEIIGVCAIIGGVALVAWGAPAHTEAHRPALDVIAVVAALSLAGLAPFFVRGTRFDSGMMTIIGCGCGFAATNVATKLLGDDFNAGHYADAAAWAVVGFGNGVSATLTNMTAFQRRAATVVVPVSTAVQTFLPIVVEPLFLEENWGSASFDGIPLLAGLVLACTGTVLIAGSRAVSEFFARAAA
jgi:drug/metabolite transporter (DMT)-like permease